MSRLRHPRRMTAILLLLSGAMADADDFSLQFEGFVEPYRTIDVASAETGRVESIHVTIGQAVEAGETLAVLDHDLQQAFVEIAQQQAQAVGGIEAAIADRGLHEVRIQQLEQLTKGGYARPEELMRAKADFAISAARVRQAQENQKISQAELARYQLQLRRRTIRSPVAGLISSLVRDPGEFVSPTEPYVARMIQVDPLVAVFNLPTTAGMQPGQQIQVLIGSQRQLQTGVIDSIAPMIDAESGTSQLRVRIANPKRALQAGEKCWLHSGPLPSRDSLDQALRLPIVDHSRTLR